MSFNLPVVYCQPGGGEMEKSSIYVYTQTNNWDLNPVFDVVRRLLNRANIEPEKELAPILLEAGEAVLFTSKCVHGSLGNTSDRQRFALVGRYTTTDVDVYPGKSPYFSFRKSIFPMDIKIPKSSLRPVAVHGDCAQYLEDWPVRRPNIEYYAD